MWSPAPRLVWHSGRSRRISPPHTQLISPSRRGRFQTCSLLDALLTHSRFSHEGGNPSPPPPNPPLHPVGAVREPPFPSRRPRACGDPSLLRHPPVPRYHPRCISLPKEQTTGAFANSGRGGSRTAFPLPRGLAPSPITVGAGFKPAPHRTYSSPIPQRPPPHAIPRLREESRAPITDPLPPSVVLASRSCPREDGAGTHPSSVTPLDPVTTLGASHYQRNKPQVPSPSRRGGSRTAFPLPRGLAPSPITVGAGFKPAPHRTYSSPIPQRPPPHAIPRLREESRAPITDPLPPSVVLASRSCPREDGGRGPIPPPSSRCTPLPPSVPRITKRTNHRCLRHPW